MKEHNGLRPLTVELPAKSCAPASETRIRCFVEGSSRDLILFWGGGVQKMGTLFRSPYDKDDRILGSILRPLGPMELSPPESEGALTKSP